MAALSLIILIVFKTFVNSVEKFWQAICFMSHAANDIFHSKTKFKTDVITRFFNNTTELKISHH